MDFKEERVFFLFKADAAEARAAVGTTDVERQTWQKIAKDYRRLAQEARAKPDKLQKSR